MSSTQKIDQQRDFAAGVYLSDAQNPIPHPPYTLYIQGKVGGGGEEGRAEPKRRFEGQQFTKPGRKYQQDWLYLQSLNSDKHLPQCLITGQFSFGVSSWFDVTKNTFLEQDL